MDVSQLVLTWAGGKTVENLRQLAYKFDLDQSKRKLSQVNPSAPRRGEKYTQVFTLHLLTTSFGHGLIHLATYLADDLSS